MKKEELLEELDAMIDEEMNITNLQENPNGETLKMLWNIKKMVEELE